MNKAFGIVFALLCFNYATALTSEETEIIKKRNEARTCGGYMEVAVVGDKITIKRDVTPDHMWGCVNPNTPRSSEKTITLDNDPKIDGDGPYCLPMGDIGIALNGISFYNPLAAGGVNAVDGGTRELFDCCDGHTAPHGDYHYHKLPNGGGCDNPIFDAAIAESKPQFLGVALDGFPIYGQWDGLNKDDLDECHGTYIPDGKTNGTRYAYIAVADHFPYILGCFKGTPSKNLQKCNAKKNHLCACNYGNGESLSYSDVTEESEQISNMNSDIAIDLEETDDKCYNDKCVIDGGFSYTDGQCVSPNGGGGGNRPFPGPNGDDNGPEQGPNGGGNGPNGGGNGRPQRPSGDDNGPEQGPNGGGNGPNGGGNGRPQRPSGDDNVPEQGPNGGGNGPNGGGNGPPQRPSGDDNGPEQGPNGGGNGPNGGGDRPPNGGNGPNEGGNGSNGSGNGRPQRPSGDDDREQNGPHGDGNGRPQRPHGNGRPQRPHGNGNRPRPVQPRPNVSGNEQHQRPHGSDGNMQRPGPFGNGEGPRPGQNGGHGRGQNRGPPSRQNGHGNGRSSPSQRRPRQQIIDIN